MATRTLKRLQTAGIQVLVEMSQNGAKTRCLSPDQVAEAARFTRAFYHHCDKHGVVATQVLLDGGAVPNSYQYHADSTQISIKRTDDGWQVSASRTWARKVPGGDYGILRGSAIKAEGETRKWTEMPALTWHGRKCKFNNAGNMYI